MKTPPQMAITLSAADTSAYKDAPASAINLHVKTSTEGVPVALSLIVTVKVA